MLVGYMRVSSADDRQSTALQRDALFAAGAMATPLVLCGVLKSVYDVGLLVMFRKVPPQD